MDAIPRDLAESPWRVELTTHELAFFEEQKGLHRKTKHNRAWCLFCVLHLGGEAERAYEVELCSPCSAEVRKVGQRP